MMKKQVTRKRRRFRYNIVQITFFSFMFSGLIYFGCAVGLRTYNNSLSTQKQSIENTIVTLSTQNDDMQTEIRELASTDRVNEVAASTGLSYNQDSIVSIGNDTTDSGE